MRAHSIAIRLVVGTALVLAAVTAVAQSPAAPAAAPPPAFRGIRLGMSVQEVQEALKADPLFRYRGAPDVSMLPQSTDPLIECEGTSYITRAWLQFAGGKLAVMDLVLDTRLLDFYSLFTTLSRKYGDPGTLDPKEAVWLSDGVRFSLERPLSVKYIDRRTFEAEVARGAAQQDLELMSRDRFLEQF